MACITSQEQQLPMKPVIPHTGVTGRSQGRSDELMRKNTGTACFRGYGMVNNAAF